MEVQNPEDYIVYHRDRFNEGLIDIHEFGKHLRAAAPYVSHEFLESGR